MTLSADGAVIVSHEPIADPLLYRDTAPIFLGDRLYPYIGRPWHRLDLPRIRTLDAGWSTGAAAVDPPSIAPKSVPCATVPTLNEVLLLVYGIAPRSFRLEIEIKHHHLGPRHAPGPALIADRVASTIRGHGMAGRCRIRSFDWRVLVAVRRLAPEIPIVVLATADSVRRGSRRTVSARMGRSPWTSALAVAATDLGATGIAPEEGIVDRALVGAARRHDLAVLPWTVNDPARARELIALGVDGLTTDRPDRMRAL